MNCIEKVETKSTLKAKSITAMTAEECFWDINNDFETKRQMVTIPR